MPFTHLDFASDIPMPDNHHTAQSVFCFSEDPYVYYKTYVQDKLPKPAIIRHQTEMLYKYELLLGAGEFEQKFNSQAPINPSTKKPYGDDTQRFAEWARTVRQDGKIPIHPTHAEVAHNAYLHTMEQIDEGFAETLGDLLKPGGQSAIQESSLIDNSYCYANVDHLTADGKICKVCLLPSLDKIEDKKFTSELAFTLVFQWLVLTHSTVPANIDYVTYAIIAEYQSPFRVHALRFDIAAALEDKVMSIIQRLNASFGDETNKVWRSKYHLPVRFTGAFLT